MRIAALTLASMLAVTAATAQTPLPPGPLYEIDLFDARPESAPQAADLLSRYAAAMRASPGCLRVDLVRQPAPTANHFAIVIGWRAAADRDRQISSAAALAFRTSFEPIAASPVDERLYTRMAL